MKPELYVPTTLKESAAIFTIIHHTGVRYQRSHIKVRSLLKFVHEDSRTGIFKCGDLYMDRRLVIDEKKRIEDMEYNEALKVGFASCW